MPKLTWPESGLLTHCSHLFVLTATNTFSLLVHKKEYCYMHSFYLIHLQSARGRHNGVKGFGGRGSWVVVVEKYG